MKNFKEIMPSELDENVFRLIGKEWTLITAGNEEKFNTMTASWGGIGVLWNKNVATIYIRPQRYTYEFVENSEYFTLSFFGDEQRDSLAFCGKFSGRDHDKAKECGLTPIKVGDSMAFDQARLVLLCKKLYHTDIVPANFYDATIEKNYNGKDDYHRMYIGEIVKVIVAE